MCYPTTRPLPLARPLTLSLPCPHLPLHVQAAAAVGVQAQEAFPAAIPPGRAVSCCWHGALLDALLSELASHTELPCNATSGPQAPTLPPPCRRCLSKQAGGGLARLPCRWPEALSLHACLQPKPHTPVPFMPTPLCCPRLLASAPNPKAGWQGCFFPLSFDPPMFTKSYEPPALLHLSPFRVKLLITHTRFACHADPVSLPLAYVLPNSPCPLNPFGWSCF